jgi:hypothetical protein
MDALDALPGHQSDATAVAIVHAAIAPPAPSPWDWLTPSSASFIMPSNVVNLAEWRERKRGAK